MNRRHFAGAVLPFVLGVPLALAQPQKANLSRLVVVGDSLSAGFQNFSLLGSQQLHSYAALVAAQAHTPLVLPLVKEPGVPNVLEITSFSPLTIEPVKATPFPFNNAMAPRVDPHASPTNLAVPGVFLAEVLSKRPTPTPNTAIDFLNNIVLGVPSGTPQSQVERAVSLSPSPTTILFWAGNNDVLLPELTGDFNLLTPPPSFFFTLDKIMQTLSGTGASLVVANLPDATVVPYFISAETIAAQTGAPVNYVRSALGLNPGDKIRPAAQRLVPGILANPTTGPLPKMCTAPIPGDPVIPGLPYTQAPCVFRNSEAQILRAYIAVFNALIQVETTLRHATLVDIHSLIDDINSKGYDVNGRHLTPDFLGGLVTLDGLHPTNTLHAIIANEFIDTMNDNLKTKIPRVSVEAVAKTDPLIFPPMQ
jgi:hypothetical protein